MHLGVAVAVVMQKGRSQGGRLANSLRREGAAALRERIRAPRWPVSF
jgi:hypothetical protein